jgi:thioredoxin reductase
MNMRKPQTLSEVIIIGGSYSGMSAAMTLGRALRKVVLIDAGKPCNRFAPHAHNLLGSDGIAPAQLHATARAQLKHYSTIELIEDNAISFKKDKALFTVTTKKGAEFMAENLLLATGLNDSLPNIPGLLDCWGKSAIHCPYCHGFEFKGGQTGILAASNEALHMINMLMQWTSDLTIFTVEGFSFNPAALDFIHQHKIRLITGKVTGLQHQAGNLEAVTIRDVSGKLGSIPLKALYVMPPIRQALEQQAALGYNLTPSGHIEVDEAGRTATKGLYAAGDNCNRFRSLAQAMASVITAGAMINYDLINKQRPLPKM